MTFGLALEGGGTRAAAHVGVLRALLEAGLHPEAISGTSAGAIVAGLYAWRRRMEDVEHAVEHVANLGLSALDLNFAGLFSAANCALHGRRPTIDGLFRGDRLERFIALATQGAALGQASMPLVIPAVDLNSQRVVAFSSRLPMAKGEYIWRQNARISQAVRASTSLPVIYQPMELDSHVLVDGGVLENLPARSLKTWGMRTVLGVVLDDAGEIGPVQENIVGIGLRTIQVMGAQLAREQERAAAYVLRVELAPSSGLFSTSEMEENEQRGYDAAARELPMIRAALSQAG